ncbi:hypothetical protein TVNIR_2725 [Thioalkalivibrio nitratireducens DSM 14787]|uniref:Methyltransferase type 11 domain-containing protein n=1 Tax=Thioalkalivibrio nitratireducens (strain DSM 14787 / UNIQEM 213 / ALEN2) TaxID=1255043 RepID=L0DXS3_THIND|nr:methyltransferase domain-containing protein [Thioalkalivibrio nitratireducens]AGA34364.1 hypothetical protein TVNIR_2725 [Thioalkalivibrio nitratireducens DSM 14787]
MDLKHSPEKRFHQASCADCLRGWYAGPQGRRVREALGREIRQRRPLHFGDSLLELAPVELVHGEWARMAWILRIGSEQAPLRTEIDRLPLSGKSFECVVLAHAGHLTEDVEPLVMEAARVLAPEGYLFLLDTTACADSGQSRWSPALPAGLWRRQYLRRLESAGLRVRRQQALSVLPAGLPGSWLRLLGRGDVLAAPWLPLLGSCVLTIAQRRETIPLTPRARWRRARMPVRAAGSSQWA